MKPIIIAFLAFSAIAVILALLDRSCNDGLDQFNEPRIVSDTAGHTYAVKRAPMSCTFDIQRVPR